MAATTFKLWRFACEKVMDLVYDGLTKEVTNLAWCFRITRSDGLVQGFTSHDADLVIAGVSYEAASGFSPSAVSASADMAVDNMEVEGVLDSAAITLEDINAGRYDGAQILVFLCDWTNPSGGSFILRKGTLGQVTGAKTPFKAEVRGLLQNLQQKAVAVYSNWCRADFCDGKCGLAVSEYTFPGKVQAINGDGSLMVDIVKPSGYFDYGLLTFTSGKSSSCIYDVKSYTSVNAISQLTTFLPLDDTVSVGDSIFLVAGCDGNLNTCIQKFNNIANFRGEPYVPGSDYMMAYPVKG